MTISGHGAQCRHALILNLSMFLLVLIRPLSALFGDIFNQPVDFPLAVLIFKSNLTGDGFVIILNHCLSQNFAVAYLHCAFKWRFEWDAHYVRPWAVKSAVYNF